MTLDALGTAGGVVSALDHRMAIGGTVAVQGPTLTDIRTGVLRGPSSAALITGTAATGTMTVNVPAFHAVTQRNAAGGVYLGPVQEVATTVNIAAAPASNSRIDVVWVKENDADTSVLTPDATTGPSLGVTTGTAAASPTKPSIPVGALELGTVTVAAGATATNGAGVTIANTARQTVARGARVPVLNQTDRDSMQVFPGLEVYRIDTGKVELYTLGAWYTLYDPTVIPAKWGSLSGTTASDGTISFTHNLGVTPSYVNAFSKTAGAVDAVHFGWISSTTTTTTIKAYYNGAVQASVSVAFFWEVRP